MAEICTAKARFLPIANIVEHPGVGGIVWLYRPYAKVLLSIRRLGECVAFR